MTDSIYRIARMRGVCVRCLSRDKARGWFAEVDERAYPSQVCGQCMTIYERSIFLPKPKGN